MKNERGGINGLVSHSVREDFAGFGHGRSCVEALSCVGSIQPGAAGPCGSLGEGTGVCLVRTIDPFSLLARFSLAPFGDVENQLCVSKSGRSSIFTGRFVQNIKPTLHSIIGYNKVL